MKRVISVTSGKGGVGKTNVVANLAVILQKQGHRVLVLDGDFGLSNLNIVMGLDAKYTVADVLSGSKSIADILVSGPRGVRLIPATSGVLTMTQLSAQDKACLTHELENMPYPFDILLIDTGAGINSDVAYLNSASNEVVVVATGEPTSIADAYALMKIMSQEYRVKHFKLLVNRIAYEKEARSVYQNLLTVSDRFLNIRIEYLGHILDDPRVGQAVRARKVLCEAWPDSIATQCFEEIASSLVSKPMEQMLTGNIQFFWRTLLNESVHQSTMGAR